MDAVAMRQPRLINLQQLHRTQHSHIILQRTTTDVHRHQFTTLYNSNLWPEQLIGRSIQEGRHLIDRASKPGRSHRPTSICETRWKVAVRRVYLYRPIYRLTINFRAKVSHVGRNQSRMLELWS
jgi:hypothetical protein